MEIAGYAVPRPVNPVRDYEDSSLTPKYVNIGRTAEKELQYIAAREAAAAGDITEGGANTTTRIDGSTTEGELEKSVQVTRCPKSERNQSLASCHRLLKSLLVLAVIMSLVLAITALVLAVINTHQLRNGAESGFQVCLSNSSLCELSNEGDSTCSVILVAQSDTVS